ncbi:hypothetical protein LEP1GSC061_1474 [Leptospira wolffii serovar Khorat str. Khorat-H2]|nr:hypothetical protein LEP1GSC061_1474 [Leptospira wolffii serovar Khorat str. Khorat-H2]
MDSFRLRTSFLQARGEFWHSSNSSFLRSWDNLSSRQSSTLP